MTLSILSHTSRSFVEAIFASLGRGKVQALDLYKRFVRTGIFIPPPPSFKNAPELLKQMEALIDTSVDPVVHTVGEASGTQKMLLKTKDGYLIESVLLSMKQKKTVCISSQIGCCRACAFCETGKMGLIRNLEASEIVGQVFQARFFLQQAIDNVVFMGMGEPLDTIQEVMRAFDILSDPHGFHIGRKNITVSTCGQVFGIETLAKYETSVPNLAVSLNAANDALRSELMPINRQFGLARLKEALQLFITLRQQEVLIAYVLLEGVNDSIMHAEELLRFVDGLAVKINLISYNSQRMGRFRPPSLEVEEQFAARIRKEGYRVLLRRTKGEKIMAGCGQLGNSCTESDLLSKKR